MHSISALVLTYNEEDYIENCLKSIKWVDEIVVIDSYSDDRTTEIAEKYTDKIYKRKFDNFSSQRNYGLDKMQGDWVLVVDADERITPELQKEILDKIKDNPGIAYRVPRKNYFLGKWIKYCGWYPDYTLRLFQNKYRYSGRVHENLEINDEIKDLDNPLIHLTYKNLEHYLSKINHYTSLSAEDMYHSGKSTSLFYVIVRPLFEFIEKGIFQKGLLLGGPGILLSILSSYYKFLKYAKLWEKNNVNRGQIINE